MTTNPAVAQEVNQMPMQAWTTTDIMESAAWRQAETADRVLIS